MRGRDRGKIMGLFEYLKDCFRHSSQAENGIGMVYPPYISAGNKLWQTDIPGLEAWCGELNSSSAGLVLWENDIELGRLFTGSTNVAAGSHPTPVARGGTLVFHTTDDSDPNTNGRRYSLTVAGTSSRPPPGEKPDANPMTYADKLLHPPFDNNGGLAWTATLVNLLEIADNSAFPRRSPLIVLENDIPLTPAHCPHVDIGQKGCGRYSHWNDHLIFSTSDQSDPNTNGRQYSIRIYGAQKALLTARLPLCAAPWQQFLLDIDGKATPCCYWGDNTVNVISLGNANKESLEEIWNNNSFMELRKKMIEGDLHDYPCADCMHARTSGGSYCSYQYYLDLIPGSESERNYWLNRQEYLQGKSHLESTPPIVSMIGTLDCNIRCSFCSQYEKRLSGAKQRPETIKAFLQWIKRAIVFSWAGGETLLDPHFRAFFDEFQKEDNPNLRLEIPTNGVLANSAFLQKLQSTFQSFSVNFSIVSFNRAIYEKLHLGSNYDVVISNLDEFVRANELSKSKRNGVMIACCLMKTNFLEMTHQIENAVQRDVPLIFSPVVVRPIHERLDIFSDFKRETSGWEEEIRHAEGYFDVHPELKKSRGFSAAGAVQDVKRIYEEAKSRYMNAIQLKIIMTNAELPDYPLPVEKITHERKCLYRVCIPRGVAANTWPVVLEDGKRFAPNEFPEWNFTQPDTVIVERGHFFFSHDRKTGQHYLCFSASDNSDPRSNDREYVLHWERRPNKDILGKERMPILLFTQGFCQDAFAYIRVEGAGERTVDLPRAAIPPNAAVIYLDDVQDSRYPLIHSSLDCDRLESPDYAIHLEGYFS